MGRWTSDERADLARTLLHLTEEATRNGKELIHLRDTQRGIDAEIERREPPAKEAWAAVKGLRAMLDLGELPPYNLDSVLEQTRTDVAAVLAGCGEPATPVTPDSMGGTSGAFHRLDTSTEDGPEGVGLVGRCPCGWETSPNPNFAAHQQVMEAYAAHFEPIVERREAEPGSLAPVCPTCGTTDVGRCPEYHRKGGR